MNQNQAQLLTVKSIKEEGRDIRSLGMLPARGLTFIPGQVAMLRVEDESPTHFAIASAPSDTMVEFLVRRAAGAGTLLYGLNAGDRVELTDLVGRGFPMDDLKGRDLVFIATGTGIAPLRSTIRHILTRLSDYGKIVFLYGVKTPDDFCYRNETELWKKAGIELRQVISQPEGFEWAGSTGYVQSLLDNVLPTLSSPIALVCGSLEMMKQTRTRLEEMGIPGERILTNY
jgi:sulfhydrogenase subunit gamma (sulfur reductase)